jgi:hypothetical protein
MIPRFYGRNLCGAYKNTDAGSLHLAVIFDKLETVKNISYSGLKNEYSEMEVFLWAIEILTKGRRRNPRKTPRRLPISFPVLKLPGLK